jgi:guanylate kinase
MEGCSIKLKDLMVNTSLELKYTLDPDVLQWSYVQTPHDMLVIGAYAAAERRFTQSMSDWMSIFMFMSAQKGYTTRTNTEHAVSEKHIRIQLKEISREISSETEERFDRINIEGFRDDHESIRMLTRLTSGMQSADDLKLLKAK